MPTARRFLAGLLVLAVGIAVPMTLDPSGVVIAVLWSLTAVALVGLVLTWEPIARRLPYRLVRSVDPHELPPETAESDARLADDCERLADDIEAWLADQDYKEPGYLTSMPPDFSAKFDGRIFRCLEALVTRRYITRDDLRRIGTGNTFMGSSEYVARQMREWSHRLRRR